MALPLLSLGAPRSVAQQVQVLFYFHGEGRCSCRPDSEGAGGGGERRKDRAGPAFAHLVLLRAGALADVKEYLYKWVLCAGAVIVIAPEDAAAPPHAPDSLAALKAQLAEIDAIEKPFPTPLTSTGQSSRQSARWSSRQTGRTEMIPKALEEGGEHPAAAPGGEFDRFGPLLDAFRAELAQYKGFLDRQSSVFMADRANFKSPYGDPLGPKVDRATSSGRSARRSGRCCFTVQRRC